VKRALAALFLAASLAPVAAAQDGPPPAGPRRAREQAFRLIDEFMASNLQPRLELTDDQLSRVLPLVRKLHADRRALAHRRLRAVGEMRRLLRAGEATEVRLQQLLAEVKAVEREEADVVGRDLEAVDAVLTPVQQAKFRVMEVELERRVREAVATARGRHGVRRRRP
jgi:hypothetical protein